MNASPGSIRRMLVQALVIVALGATIGIADSQVRRVKIGREAPATLPIAVTPEPAPVNNGSQQPAAPPTPAPKLAHLQPSASGAFTPTPKDQLPAGQITLAEAKMLFDSPQVSFVDARTRENYALGHIRGAVRLQLEDFQKGVPPKLGLIPRENKIVVYCSGGNCDESERVAEQLEGSGYRNIYIIHDGFPGWKAMNFPIEIAEDDVE